MREKIGNKAFNYLLGFEIDKFNSKKLPTYREVMNVFMHKHRGLKMTIRQSCGEVVNELNDIWSKFLIPTCHRQQSIRKMENFHKEYTNLKKNRKGRKKSKAQREKIDKFNLKLNQLFDITNNGKYENLSDSCKEFLNKSKERINCFQLADEILRQSAVHDNQNIDESMKYEEDINLNELQQSSER